MTTITIDGTIIINGITYVINNGSNITIETTGGTLGIGGLYELISRADKENIKIDEVTELKYIISRVMYTAIIYFTFYYLASRPARRQGSYG